MDNPPDFIHASVFPSTLTDSEEELSVSSVKTANVMVQYVACNYMQQHYISDVTYRYMLTMLYGGCNKQ